MQETRLEVRWIWGQSKEAQNLKQLGYGCIKLWRIKKRALRNLSLLGDASELWDPCDCTVSTTTQHAPREYIIHHQGTQLCALKTSHSRLYAFLASFFRTGFSLLYSSLPFQLSFL